ncbi:hypothetical protein H632_c68p1 [Helicosporidium sp. ATCC 50920]|nr:hypothetical protein H632_c68p1 [Helicosporidium sp. ATCC 50920]|eukprot:KDD76915.1 hypothetical protein H632_c68p1 [Helicosporidium sp. ATCC 50920]
MLAASLSYTVTQQCLWHHFVQGMLSQLDTQSPVLYIEFPQGRLKLFGTLCFPRAKYIVLRSLSKSLLCEDVLESMVCLDVSAAIVRETVQCLFMSPFATLQIVFQEAWWIGTAEENPGELRLEMPHDLAAPGEVAVPAVDTLPEVQAPTPASVRATPKRRRDMEDDDSDSPHGGPSPRARYVRLRRERASSLLMTTHEKICKECFYVALEEEVHEVIVANALFRRGERVAIAASGGKDSTVLAHMMTTLNARHDYGLDLFLLSIDEGIKGYRDDSLETVKRNEQQYKIPLTVCSYKDLYGWAMDEIVAEIGTRSNCTFCGVFRRQALDRGAVLCKAHKIATGHNADDVAETVLLNLLRADVPRLGRCTSIITGANSAMPRVKPFKYTYEKEIVMYAYFKNLDYFSTECIYSPFAARGLAREYIKDLEAVRPRAILDLIHAGEDLRVGDAANAAAPQPGNCERCGYLSSQPYSFI